MAQVRKIKTYTFSVTKQKIPMPPAGYQGRKSPHAAIRQALDELKVGESLYIPGIKPGVCQASIMGVVNKKWHGKRTYNTRFWTEKNTTGYRIWRTK